MNRGPRPEGSAEDAFVKNLRNAAASWLHRLRSPHALHEAHAIGQEAFELRGIAEKHGLRAIAGHLVELERASRESPYSAINAATALEQLLTPIQRDAVPQAQPQAPGYPPNASPYAGPNAPRPGSHRPAMPITFDPTASMMGPTSIAPPPLIGDFEGTKSPPLLNQTNLPGEPLRAPDARHATMASQRSEVQRGDGWQRPPPMVADAPRGARPQPPANEALPESTARPAPPKLLLKTVLHLRAFGKSGPDSAARIARAKEAAAPERGQSLLGFRGIAQNAPAAPEPPPRLPSAPPRQEETPALPRMITRPPTPPRGSAAASGVRRPSGPVAAASRVARPSTNGVPRWFYIVGALVGLLAVTTVVIVVVSSSSAVPTATKTDAAAARLVVSDGAGPASEGPSKAVEAVHGLGRETSELRALIDQQDQMIAKCRVDASKCDTWARQALLLGPVDAGALLTVTRGPDGPPSWLQHLTLPADFQTKDDPSLVSFLEYVTKNPKGRGDFQQLLFNCSKYMDLFDSVLKKYGAPTWLKVVAFQESRCIPEATSPVGARGLWQFMPDSGRAYGLMVNDDDIDERLNPAKSTDAAVHFLTDLYAKLGAWDLTLAAYNAGPFSVAQRILQVGGSAGFWDLRRSDLLPKETAEYVPAIEVYALVVENRQKFKFVMTLPLAESAAELNVRPGTRLSLIARVSRTSLSKIKQLNPDFLGAVVPSKVTTMRIPVAGEQAFQVQQELNSWPEDDTRDTCVPRDYVWGSDVFEQTSYAKKCAKNPSPQ